MKRTKSFSRRLAFGLIQCATRLLPKTRREWARSMDSELQHLESDFEALVWAIGCTIASIKERINAMNIGDFKISRWILAPEMALCFAPLTFAWWDGVFGVSGIVRLNMEVIQQYFIGTPGGVITLVMMFSVAILGVLGPVGLLAAFRLITLGRPIRSRSLSMALIGGPILLGIICVARSLIMESGLGVQVVEKSGVLLLFSVLPVVGAAHILYLGSSNTNQELAA